MLSSILPSRILIALQATLSGLLLALEFTRLAQLTIVLIAVGAALVLLAALAADLHLSSAHWRPVPLDLTRHLPYAFALGEAVSMRLTLENPSAVRRLGRYFELADPSLLMPAMPLRFAVAAHGRETLEFDLKPTARGMKSFPAAQVLLRSSLGLLDWNLRIGTSQSRRVFPNFKRQTVLIGRSKGRLAGRRPVTPSFQSAHDDCVMFLLDCGRRMVAGDTQSGFVAGDFDRSLEALMQLARLALSIGDAVGALTFGTQPGAQTRFTPRKGPQAFGALMAELGDAEPSPVFSDYTAAAAALVRCRRKHSLVVVITVCRDEDDGELTAALRLLCARHRVILASLKEQILAGLAAQPLARRESVLEVAAAQDYHQRRAELLARLAAAGALLIDCEPRMLGVELVNRYASLKRTGTI